MAEKVSIIVQLKDLASKASKDIDNGFKKLKKTVKDLLSPWNILLGATGLFAAATVKTVRALAKLQTKMVNVGNLTGASRKEVNKMTDELIKLSGTIPQSVDNLAESLFDVVSAGVPAGESIAFLETAGKLATAGVTDTKTAVDGLTSVMNAFGMEASDATKIADQFFAAQQKGKTTIAELSNSIGQVAPIAAGLGVSFEELVSQMSTVTLSGIKTSEAATGLKATLSNLLKPSEQAADAAALLGIEFDANAVQSKGLTNVLKDVIDKTGGSKVAMGQLFGSMEAVNTVLALSQNNFETLNEVQESVANSAGSMDKAFDETMNTFNAQLDVATNKLFHFGATFLKYVIPIVTKALKLFNKVSEEIEYLFGEQKEKTVQELKDANAQITKDIEKAENSRVKIFKKSKIKTLRIQLEHNKKLIAEIESRKKKNKKIVTEEEEDYKEAKKAEVEALISSLEEREAARKDASKKEKQLRKEENDEFKKMMDLRDQYIQEQTRNAEKEAKKIKDIYGNTLKDVTDKVKAFFADPVTAMISIIIEKAEVALNAIDQIISGTDLEARGAGLRRTKQRRQSTLQREVSRGQIEAEESARRALELEEDYRDELRELRDQAIRDSRWRVSDTLDPIGAAARMLTAETARDKLSEMIDAANTNIATFKEASNFALGGIVPGTSFTGDKVPAMMNSGELVLNARQQRNIGEMIFNVANNPGQAPSNRGMEQSLQRIEAALMMPQRIEFRGDDLTRGIAKRTKRLTRTGQISAKG